MTAIPEDDDTISHNPKQRTEKGDDEVTIPLLPAGAKATTLDGPATIASHIPNGELLVYG